MREQDVGWERKIKRLERKAKESNLKIRYEGQRRLTLVAGAVKSGGTFWHAAHPHLGKKIDADLAEDEFRYHAPITGVAPPRHAVLTLLAVLFRPFA